MTTLKCKMCNATMKGRSDKLFCSLDCKNEYHVKLRQVTNHATKSIDTILHRNRSILLEFMGKNSTSKTVQKLVLDNKKFNYSYVTAYHLNSRNKMINHVYDFSWVVFGSDKILITRKR